MHEIAGRGRFKNVLQCATFVVSIVCCTLTIVELFCIFIFSFLAASTECSAGSNDHFVVGVGAVGVPSLVQFGGRPLGGANFQY
jgi:hypothetical protein